MSINIGDKPEMNVVNVGDELTADQVAALQNAQGASATNPCLTRTNTFNTADAAVRITQDGTGEAFRVEDVTGDTSPFIITSDGRVGVGRTPTAGYSLDVAGTLLAAASTVSFIVSGSSVIVNSSSSSDTFRITNTGTGNSFVVEDSANPDATPFVIDASGNIGIGRSPTSRKMEMTGNFAVTGQSTLESSGSSSALLVSQSGTASACVITNTGTGNSFVVADEATDTTQFVIDNAGNVTLGGSLTLESAAYNANTALVIDNTNYPHELTFKVGATTYRVPARAI